MALADAPIMPAFPAERDLSTSGGVHARTVAQRAHGNAALGAATSYRAFRRHLQGGLENTPDRLADGALDRPRIARIPASGIAPMCRYGTHRMCVPNNKIG